MSESPSACYVGPRQSGGGSREQMRRYNRREMKILIINLIYYNNSL